MKENRVKTNHFFFKGFGKPSSKKLTWKLQAFSQINNTRQGDKKSFIDFQQLANSCQDITITDLSSASWISDEDMNQIIKDIMLDRKCTEKEAFTAIALLAQSGATSSRAQSGIQIKLNNTIFKLELIKNIVKKNTSGKNIRRLAKTFASEFCTIASIHKINGNLLNKIKLNYPNFKLWEDKDRFWVSDFQSENESCPQYIRDILTQYYNEHVQPKNKK